MVNQIVFDKKKAVIRVKKEQVYEIKDMNLHSSRSNTQQTVDKEIYFGVDTIDKIYNCPSQKQTLVNFGECERLGIVLIGSN